MKQKLILATVVTMIIAACGQSAAPDKGCGTMLLDIKQDTNVETVTKSDISDYVTVPQSNDFDISILNYAGATYWQGKLKDWDSEKMKMTEGEYTVIARYGNTEDEGEGKVCLQGSQSCTINAFEQTDVTVTVKPANAIVRIELSKLFKTYFKSYGFSLSTGAGNTFQIAEGQSIFIDAFKFTLSGKCMTDDDKSVSFEKEFNGLSQATCYTVSVDVSNVGSGAITIKLNNDVETINIEEDLN